MRLADGPTAEAVVDVDAPPERVWELVTDLHLIASLSQEVQQVEWLGGVDAPAVGHRFRGRSAHPAIGEWTTTSHVVVCDRPRLFGWDVGLRNRPTAAWRFELVERPGGTTLRQWARMGPGPSHVRVAIERRPQDEERIVDGRLRQWRDGMERNLAAIKELAER